MRGGLIVSSLDSGSKGPIRVSALAESLFCVLGWDTLKKEGKGNIAFEDW